MMGKAIRQILKAVCYVLLFLGVQIIVSFVFQFGYGFKVGMESAATGIPVDEQMLVENLMEFITNNTNLITFISGAATILTLLLVFKIRKKKLAAEVTLVKFDTAKIVPVIMLGVASALFVSNLMELLPIPESVMASYAESSKGILAGSPVMMVLSVIIMAPLVEEIIFRGLVLSRLKKVMPTWLAVVLCSMVFGLMHGQLIWIVYTTLFGLLLAVVAENANSIWASVLLHMAFNLVGSFVDYIPMSTGMMWIVMIVSIVVGVGAAYLLMRNQQVEMQQKAVTLS